MPKILAIDDRRDNLITITALLKHLMPECVVITAQSGPEGIDQALVERPDTVLLDVHMPGMDGFETCRRLKADERTRSIPVVMVTAVRTDAASRIKGLELGADAFLSKPIDEQELVSQLKVALRIKTAEDALRAERDSLETLVQRSTAELRKSEERSRLILLSAMDGFWRVDLQGRMLEVNDTYCRMSGYTRQELLTMSIPDVEALETPAEIALHFRKLMEQTEDRFESRHRRKDGTVFDVEISVQYRECEEEQIVVFLRDITERKRAENALRESEERFRAATDASLDCLLLLRSDRDEAGQIKDFIFVDLNHRSEEMLCMSRERMIGKRLCEELPINREAGFFEKYKRVVETGEPLEEEFFLPETHVPACWYFHQVVRVDDGIFICHRDITERKRADEHLQRIRFSIENLSDSVFWVGETGRFTDVNASACRKLGYTREELLTMSVADIDPSLPSEQWIPHWEEMQQCGLKVIETVHRTRNGSMIRMELVIHHQVFGNTRYNCVLGRDITDRKRAEAEKQKLEEQLRQALKMESVGRLAGGVAHDFNNMLGVILGYTDMALDQVDPAQPLFTALREVRKAAERSADLTRQLLTFARKQTIAPRVLDLNETVDGMLNMLRRLIGEDVDLVWKPVRNLWPVKVDPSQIDQLLANLCVNARDAIAGVGKVTIETDAAAFDDAWCADHAGFVPGEYVLLTFSDNGCGMDQETLGHLFEPFFTTKGVGKGTGLGLATVYGIVQQNNGFVNVSSEPGRGTTFKVYLPRHADQTAPLCETAPSRSAEHGDETILLVEDEPAILRMTAHVLERLGYTVVGAKSPGEAIRLAEAHAGAIHLLVTDVVMPERNGRDLAEHLLSLHPNLKCLFMSGYTADVIAHHGVLAAGVQFIQKPFSLKDLAAKLRQVLGGETAAGVGGGRGEQ